MDITTASPVEIDTRIAELHGEVGKTSATIDRLTNRVLDRAGLREYVSATWQNRRSSYRTTGTFEDGVVALHAYADAFEAWVAAGYPQGQAPKSLSNYSGHMRHAEIDATVAERDEAKARRFELWTEINELNAEWIRRGRWNRYYLVVSSAGHIHSSTGCKTCRLTTVFGWMPNMSGQTEAEAIEALGRHADSLCSVCYPSAPVAVNRTNVTKAQAAKLATAEVAKPE